ncbi:MAG: hypothetical protein OXC68_11365 [Aestuariivita sp.]|nr:hypothetical protein [Aestuariivita sp.]
MKESADKTEATYKDGAEGLSARRIGRGDAARHASGYFQADVELEATFGTTTELEGFINNFRPAEGEKGTEHVSSSWDVDLKGTTADFASALTATDNSDATWTANAYGGSTTERPKGIHGTFNTNFDNDNGKAWGVYHTER